MKGKEEGTTGGEGMLPPACATSRTLRGASSSRRALRHCACRRWSSGSSPDGAGRIPSGCCPAARPVHSRRRTTHAAASPAAHSARVAAPLAPRTAQRLQPVPLRIVPPPPAAPDHAPRHAPASTPPPADTRHALPPPMPRLPDRRDCASRRAWTARSRLPRGRPAQHFCLTPTYGAYPA